MNRYFLVIVYVTATAWVCVSLALNDSPYLAFWLGLFLLGNTSVKIR